MRVLIVRNDKLGDFMLSYPAFALLKINNPTCEIHALVPQYTYEMAKACSWIDEIVIDPGSSAPFWEQLKLLRLLKHNQYDALITLYSTTRIALLGLLAKINIRIAPATKLAQFFYTIRIKQRRSRSEKPEYQYNMELVKHYLSCLGINKISEPEPPFLKFNLARIHDLRTIFCEDHDISPNSRLVFIHSGSGGSAVNLSTSQYVLLAEKLLSTGNISIVITAGPSELDNANAFAEQLKKYPVSIYHSTNGLLEFAQHIAICDLFISGSTGPLHIAGALDRPTVAFYPRRRSATALRWQTLNSSSRRLAFSPPNSSEETDMSNIDIDSVANEIKNTFLISQSNQTSE